MRLCVISFYVLTFYCVDVVEDLGLDQHRTFSYVLSYHINRGTQKANQRYLLFKSFHSRNRELLIIKAVKCYVQPLLEVNSQVWSPHLLKDIRQQEAVQRRFTKKACWPSSTSRLRTTQANWAGATGSKTYIHADLIIHTQTVLWSHLPRHPRFLPSF